MDDWLGECLVCGKGHKRELDYEICGLTSKMLQLETDLLIEQLAIKNVIFIIAGKDSEGNPTSRVNFLQRLRQLIDIEQKYENLVRH